MENTIILTGATIFYLAALLGYAMLLVGRAELWGKVASRALRIGFFLHSVGFVYRWVESYQMGIGRIPLSKLFESLVFFSWAIILLYLILEVRAKSRVLGIFVLPFAVTAMAIATLHPDIDRTIQPLIPALKSNWLTIHVVTSFLGYAGFTLSCAMGILFLIKNNAERRNRTKGRFFSLMPSLAVVDELNYQGAVFGLVFFALGIITGSVWAHSAWGAYWSWDPKEVWSLITWLIYAIMVHARYVRGWRGKRLAVMAIVGFGAVMFTYMGVNFLPGLHSYLW